jgi:hypothetical protein
MKLYAEVPYFRTRQLLLDGAVLLWVYVWVRVGLFMRDLVEKLAGPGRTIEEAGSGLASNLDSISGQVGDVPLVGEALQSPFGAAADASRVLERAGQTHQDVIHSLAFWLGLFLALIPILYMLIKYLPGRLRWIREASAASKLRIDADDLYLFALRAVATRPLYELRRACPDPAECLASKDYEPLAALELSALGLNAAPH